MLHEPLSPTSSASRSGCSDTSSATAPAPCVGSPAVFSPYRAMSEHTTTATRPAASARGNPLRGRHQPRRAAVARVLRVIHAHRPRQLQQPLDVRGHRLGVIHPRLRAHHQHADAGRIHAVHPQQPRRRRGRQRHRVLTWIRHGHLPRAQPRGVLGRIHSSRPGQLLDVHVAAGYGDGQRFDSNGFLHDLMSSLGNSVGAAAGLGTTSPRTNSSTMPSAI